MGNRKKALTLWLLLCFTLSLFPVAAFAGEPTPGPGPDAKVTLEQAVQIAKDNFPIPAAYTEFSYSYENNNTPQWNLHWSSNANDPGFFSVQVEVQTGLIVGMNQSLSDQNGGGPSLQIPTVSREAALATAEALLQKLIPDYINNLQLDNELSNPNLSPIQSNAYNFYWKRTADGIPFLGNGASITVDTRKGTILNYNLNWTKAPLPSPSNAIPLEKALQAFQDAKMLKAQYFQIPTAMNKTPQIQLVYALQYGGIFDAVTGKPVISSDPVLGARGGMGIMDSKGFQPLTPEEQKEIQKAATLIDQEKAVAIAKQWVSIPDDVPLRNASLESSWTIHDQKIWNLNWSNENPGIPRFFSAQIDAVSGEVLGFDMFAEANGVASITRDQARTLAQEFLKKIQPKRAEEVLITEGEPSPEAKILINKQPIQNFTFTRVVNGIELPSNSITISIDTVNRQVIGYNMQWGAYNLPSAAGIMTPPQAVEAFLKQRPLTLSYSVDNQYTNQSKVRLVYQPGFTPNQPIGDLIDAKTGQMLDWQGNPLQNKPLTPFNDLENTPDKDAINYLGQLGIFREYGDAFRPDETVTAVSFFRALLHVRGYFNPNQALSDEEVFAMARTNGWLEEQLNPKDALTRQYLARVMVRSLNLQRAAEIKGIYRVEFSDIADIAPESLGYVAIAKGLNLIKGNGETYGPTQFVSRAEAAGALFRSLKTPQ